MPIFDIDILNILLFVEITAGLTGPTGKIAPHTPARRVKDPICAHFDCTKGLVNYFSQSCCAHFPLLQVLCKCQAEEMLYTQLDFSPLSCCIAVGYFSYLAS